MITIVKLENGNLSVTLDGGEDEKFETMRLLEERGFWSVMMDLFESYSCNGSYTPFNAGDANPFVGLTDAPCIAESMDYDDEGNASIIGDFWYYQDYTIFCPIEELCTRDNVTFTLAT